MTKKIYNLILLPISVFSLMGCNSDRNLTDKEKEMYEYIGECGCVGLAGFCRESVKYNSQIHNIPSWASSYYQDIELGINDENIYFQIFNPVFALTYDEYEKQVNELGVSFDEIDIKEMYKKCFGIFLIRKYKQPSKYWYSDFRVDGNDASLGSTETADLGKLESYIEIVWIQYHYKERYNLVSGREYNWTSNYVAKRPKK